MNLTSPSAVRNLLSELGVRPRRSLGQNFLIDRNIREIIVDAAGLSATDTVLEVGPGLGVLTERLLEEAGRVIAVEKDPVLCDSLSQRLGSQESLDLRCADMLEVRLDEVGPIDKVVSNLPYSAGSRILVDLAQARPGPACMVVTVQAEVGDRLLARPATRDYGLLSVLVGRAYTAEKIKKVSPSCFWPVPDVSSTVIRLASRQVEPLTPEAERLFGEVTREMFSHRRKQVATILARTRSGWRRDRAGAQELLAGLDLPERVRPADLPADTWCRLAGLLAEGR